MGDVIKSVLKGGVLNNRSDVYKYLMSDECVVELRKEFDNEDISEVLISSIIKDILKYVKCNYGEAELTSIKSRLFERDGKVCNIVRNAILPLMNIRMLMVIKFITADYLGNYVRLARFKDFGVCLSKFRYILEAEDLNNEELLNDSEKLYNIMIGLVSDSLCKSELVQAGVRDRADVLDSKLMGKAVDDNDTIVVIIDDILRKYTLSEDFIKLYREAAALQLGEGCFIVLNNRCVKCGEIQTVTVNKVSFIKWGLEGELIQSAMPELSSADRELLLSGICGKCW